MALQLPVIAPQSDPFHLAPHRIKRCTFRRLINVELGHERVYDVECLFPDRQVPIPLGDLEVGDADLQQLHRTAHVPTRRGLIGPRRSSVVFGPRRYAVASAMLVVANLPGCPGSGRRSRLHRRIEQLATVSPHEPSAQTSKPQPAKVGAQGALVDEPKRDKAEPLSRLDVARVVVDEHRVGGFDPIRDHEVFEDPGVGFCGADVA